MTGATMLTFRFVHRGPISCQHRRAFQRALYVTPMELQSQAVERSRHCRPAGPESGLEAGGSLKVKGEDEQLTEEADVEREPDDRGDGEAGTGEQRHGQHRVVGLLSAECVDFEQLLAEWFRRRV